MLRARRFLLVLWAGSLWTIGLLVAPTLFVMLDDPAQAGRLAARFFAAQTYLGLVAALLWWLVTDKRLMLTRWLALAIAAVLTVMHFGVAPVMSQYSWGHGLASALYLTACILAAVLVFIYPSPAE